MTTSYLNCPRCGLSLEVHADHSSHSGNAPEAICPRCRGRANVLVPMYETDRPRPPVQAPEPVASAA